MPRHGLLPLRVLEQLRRPQKRVFQRVRPRISQHSRSSSLLSPVDRCSTVDGGSPWYWEACTTRGIDWEDAGWAQRQPRMRLRIWRAYGGRAYDGAPRYAPVPCSSQQFLREFADLFATREDNRLG